MPYNPAWPEAVYFNPTTNRIPLSIFGNHFRFAHEEARSNFLPGIDTARYDDIDTAWLGIAPKPVTVPILPVQQMSLAERHEKLKQIREAKKAARKRK